MSRPADPRLPERDQEIADALRERIDAPPLDPRFRDELWARIDAENAGASADAGEIARPLRRRHFAGRRAWYAAAAVVAAAAVFAFAVLPALRGADTATAADMLHAMTSPAFTPPVVRLHATLRGALVLNGQPTRLDISVAATLTMSSTGDSREVVDDMLRGSANVGAFGTGTVESYDSATATRRSMILGVAPSRAACSVWKPESPLPFDPGDLAVAVGSKNWYLSMFDQYTSSVRAALAEADPNLPVQATVCVGRKAWRVVFPLRMYMGMGAKKLKTIGRVTVAVDRQTGILLYARYAVAYGGAAGRAWEEYRVDRLDLSPTLEPGWNVVRFPARAPVTVTDNGTRFSPLVKVVQRSWPLLPLAPRATPQGYRLSLASTNGMDYPPPYAKPQPSLKRRWEVGRVTYKRPYWSAPDARVQLVYRHGYSAFAVETYPLPAMGPYQALGDQMRAGGQDVRLTSGRLKGRLARIWVLPGNGGGPLLVCYDEREVVVIWGDLTRSELLTLANSLKALGDVNKPLPVTL